MSETMIEAVHPLLGLDDDIAADFAAVGVSLVPDAERSADPAQLEAAAAIALRRAAYAEQELERLQETAELQLAAVRAHYERRMVPVRARHAQLIRYVETLAEITAWGKKKSAETPNGSYGVKQYAATVAVEDDAALLADTIATAPQYVKATVTVPLPEARERFTGDELKAAATLKVQWADLKKTIDADGYLPPGVVRVDPRREAFAKPSLIP